MENYNNIPDKELQQEERAGVYVEIDLSTSPSQIEYNRSIGFPTVNDLMPVLDEDAPKIEDTLDPAFFESIDFLRETKPTEQIQQRVDTDRHWRIWLDGFLEILNVRMYYYEAAHEAFFKIKKGDSNETSRALGYMEHTNRYILKANFIREYSSRPKWLKRLLLHIAKFQQEEDRFVRFIRFDAPEEDQIIEDKPKTGVISKRVAEVLRQFNSPKKVNQISNSKIIPDGFFDPRPNRCSETIDQLFSSMKREYELIKQIASQSKGVESDSASLELERFSSNCSGSRHGGYSFGKWLDRTDPSVCQ